MIRDQFRSFAEEEVRPFAHGWHERDELIPLAVIEQLAELGVFGLTIPEEFGGSGLGKDGDVRRHRGAVAAAISASARSARARRSPPS